MSEMKARLELNYHPLKNKKEWCFGKLCLFFFIDRMDDVCVAIHDLIKCHDSDKKVGRDLLTSNITLF